MSDSIESNEERPCLHCLIGDVIDDFYAEYGSASGDRDAIDVDEVITALAKTVAELTYGSDGALRQRILDTGNFRVRVRICQRAGERHATLSRDSGALAQKK